MKARLGLTVGASSLHGAVVRGTRTIWSARATYTTLADLKETIAALAAERPRGVSRARVAITSELARVKEVGGMPPLGRRDLAVHVRLNSRRYFLQNGVALVIDARLLKGAGAPGTVQMAAAPEPVIDATLAGLAQAGLVCDGIMPSALLPSSSEAELAASVATARSGALQLLPGAILESRAEDARRRLVRWAWLAAGAMALVLAAWIVRLQWDARAARRKLAAMDSRHQSAMLVQRDLVAAEAALAAVRAAREDGFEATSLIAAITRSLPDSTFLSSLRVSGDGSVHVTGYASRTGDVLRGLERAGLRAVALDGPVTREAVANRERERFTATAFAGSGRQP